MADGRALQCGTSHFLGQNFAKAFEIRFLDETNQLQHVWQTSWGVSTRLLGAIIMVHGDDQGLRLPPAVAPTQAVIVPISRKPDEAEKVLAAARAMRDNLDSAGIRVKIDEREGVSPGFKFNDWEMRGVPIRIEIGPRDVATWRGRARAARSPRPRGEAVGAAWRCRIAGYSAAGGNSEIALRTSARRAQREHSRIRRLHRIHQAERWRAKAAGWPTCTGSNPECETKIREQTKATCRAIPLNQSGPRRQMPQGGEPAPERAYFAKAY